MCSNFARFTMQNQGGAVLSFSQNAEYKTISLMSAVFEAAYEEEVKRAIAYRFQLASLRHTQIQQQLRDVTRVVRVKNPTLLN